ncbi:hypothetical protein BDR03DRAFT_191517 [Suillus americanus]|nr:hypothetical protein BDR03DRAFT_191517 [Suillus americanus]
MILGSGLSYSRNSDDNRSTWAQILFGRFRYSIILTIYSATQMPLVTPLVSTSARTMASTKLIFCASNGPRNNHCGNEKMTVSRLSIDRTVNYTQTGYRQGHLSGSRTCMKGRAIRTLSNCTVVRCNN